MIYYITKNKELYIGDKILGDREATAEEILEILGDPIKNFKQEKLLEINQEYESQATYIKENIPQTEILTWDIQKNEAENWQKDNSFPTPFIDTMAQSRNMGKTELMTKIINKTKNFNLYIANLTGRRQKYEDQIEQATTIQELENIKWENI